MNTRVYCAYGGTAADENVRLLPLQRHSGWRVRSLCKHLTRRSMRFRIFTVCVLFSFMNGSNDVHINCRRYLRAFFMTFIPVVVLVMHYGPVTLLKFPDSVSIVLQTSRSF